MQDIADKVLALLRKAHVKQVFLELYADVLTYADVCGQSAGAVVQGVQEAGVHRAVC